MQAIYEPVVRDTAISFEAEPPSIAEMRVRIAATLAADLPWLIFARGADTLGYAYAARHRDRAAYRWSVEVSVDIHADFRRHGVGRALYWGGRTRTLWPNGSETLASWPFMSCRARVITTE